MLVFENKLKDFIGNENSDLIQEENEFIKKFLFSIEAELFDSQNQQNNLIDLSEISENPASLESFCHGYFVRDNYVKMLLSITSNLVEKFKGYLLKKEEDASELEKLFVKTREDFELIKLNLSENKEAYARSEEKNKKLMEEINNLELANEKIKEELLASQEKILNFFEIQQKINELQNEEDPKDIIIQELKEENKSLKISYKQIKNELTNSQQEIHNIQEKYLLHLESQQKLTASLQSLEIVNKKISLDYQKLFEENNKMMEKNEELLVQISENQRSQASEDEETTETANTNSNLMNPPKPKTLQRAGSLFEEIICLRNIEQLEFNEENNCEEVSFSSSKKRNLSLDYNPSFINGFSINDEPRKHSPKFLSLDEKNKINKRKVLEENKIKAHNAYEDFFLLTCQSVKLNFKYMDEILDVDIRPFFKEVLENRIPFHKWYEWIESKLYKIYEEKIKTTEKKKDVLTKKKRFFFF